MFAVIRDKFTRMLENVSGGYINEILYSIIYVLPLIIYSALISLGSPLNPLSTSFPHTDAQVYIYVAESMLQGFTPYVDVFDHKGLLLYILQICGLILGNGDIWGIWIIIFVSLTTSSVFCYFTVKNIIPSKLGAMTATLLLLTTLDGGSFAGGDTTEVMGLPFIFVSLYFLSKNIFLDKEIKSIEAVIIGACLGCVLMIKISMAVLWLILPVYIIIKLCYSRDYRKVLSFLGWGFVGLLLIIVPQIIYLINVGAFNEFLNIYLGYNLEYVDRGSLRDGIYTLYGYVTEVQLILAELVLIIVLASKRTPPKMKAICFVFMTFYVATLLNISFIGHQYSYYAPIILPCLCVPFAWLFCWVEHSIGMDVFTLGRVFALLICVSIVGVGGIASTITNIDTRSISEEDERVIELLREHTDSNDTITVLSNRNYYYLESGRTSASRYSYYIFTNRPDREKEFLVDLEENRPKVVIIGAHVTEDVLTPGIYRYLFDNYKLLESLDRFNVYVRSHIE
jgi:hypothetical protein